VMLGKANNINEWMNHFFNVSSGFFITVLGIGIYCLFFRGLKGIVEK